MTDVKPSKSAKKREYLALQKLGEELTGLREADILTLPLEDDLRTAVLDARRMKARGALRRQRQYIGKLMRHADAESIRQALVRLRR